MTTIVNGSAELRGLVGRHLGWSDWLLVEQDRVDEFARATNDFQWIHTDPVKAKESPFGGTIAHGYLTLSLVPGLLSQVVKVGGMAFGVNYGTNKVRFPSPVLVGSKLRLGATVSQVDDVTGGLQVTIDVTLEVEDAAKPSCVAQVVYRYYE